MNDKELFWSLISPHLVDGGGHRVSWGIEEAMANEGEGINWDLQRFVTRNHKFVMPDLVWKNDFDEWAGYDMIPLNRNPDKMIIVRRLDYRVRGNRSHILFFNLRESLVEISLTQMHNSETEYALSMMYVYPHKDYNPPYHKGVMEYAVWPMGQTFINWRTDPFTLK